MSDILRALRGKKTYLAAAGLAGLALYQFSTAKTPADFYGAYQSALGALAAFGLRNALEPVSPSSAPPANQDVTPPQS